MVHHTQDDPEVTSERYQKTLESIGRMSRLVYERLADGRVSGLISHQSSQQCQAAWERTTQEFPEGYVPGEWGDAEGFYDQDTGEVHTDGGEDPVGTLVHELMHALDWNKPSHPGAQGGYVLSGTPEWKRAWAAEIAVPGDPLNAYASLDPVEGLAEAGRLIFAEKGGMETAQKYFPRCFAVFASWGMV
jgi:hypothetical protein